MHPSGVVFVVDDDLSVREAVRSLIRSTGLDCKTFESADAFLRQPPPDAPACLVLDVHLSDGSGLDLVPELRRAGVEMPIVFITGYGTIPMMVRAMKGGAVEFLTKPFSEAELLGAVELALDRDRRARAEQKLLRARFAKLTAREREVFSRVAGGRTNEEIAAELDTVEQTVSAHLGRVMKKLEARSVADLVRLAEQLSSPSV